MFFNLHFLILSVFNDQNLLRVQDCFGHQVFADCLVAMNGRVTEDVWRSAFTGVSRVVTRFGDTGTLEDKRWGQHTLGPLKCSGDSEPPSPLFTPVG